MPAEPETEKTFNDVVDCLVVEDKRRLVVEKPDVWWLARKKPTAMDGSFMVVVFECKQSMQLAKKRNPAPGGTRTQLTVQE